MKKEYVDHYATGVMYKWLNTVSNQIGDAPFRAVVQNFICYPDPLVNGKLRIQSFTEKFNEVVRQLETMPDPEPPPELIEIGSLDLEEFEAERKANEISIDVLADMGEEDGS